MNVWWSADYKHGAFLGVPIVAAIPDAIDGYEAHHAFRLLDDFLYRGPDGAAGFVPAGECTDWASIPELFALLIGTPGAGPYRYGAVVHDHLCGKAKNRDDLFAANRLFWHLCIAGGCSMALADSMLLAVNLWAATKFPEPRERPEDQI